MTYIDERGEKVRPFVIHRAILGSIDRFMAYLIEETKGAFPLWLSPTQVNIIPVSNDYHLDYANKILDLLRKEGIRVEVDSREEKVGYKMRNSQMRKIPYTVILGDKERDDNQISFRRHGSEETVFVTIKEFIEILSDEIRNKK